MARIEAATHIEAPPARVWAVLVDWETQPEWMADARSVVVTSERREGIGVVLRCRTAIGVVLVNDDMAVTEWAPPRVLGVRHLGRIIHGVGAFELVPTPDGTHLTWWEEVDPPLGALGEAVTAAVVAPLVGRVFRGSLASLKRLCESAPVA